jgi:hypothetical protein
MWVALSKFQVGCKKIVSIMFLHVGNYLQD